MSHVGKRIKLKGTSQKGKNRVRDWGETWVVLAETNTILFAPSMPGPWLYISPVGCGHLHKAARWIKLTDDADFTISPAD